jgi:hypothetical protein
MERIHGDPPEPIRDEARARRLRSARDERWGSSPPGRRRPGLRPQPEGHPRHVAASTSIVMA